MVESDVLKLWLPGVLVREELPCRPSPELLDRSLCSARAPFGSLPGGDPGVGGEGWVPLAAGGPSLPGTGVGFRSQGPSPWGSFSARQACRGAGWNAGSGPGPRRTGVSPRLRRISALFIQNSATRSLRLRASSPGRGLPSVSLVTPWLFTGRGARGVEVLAGTGWKRMGDTVGDGTVASADG